MAPKFNHSVVDQDNNLQEPSPNMANSHSMSDDNIARAMLTDPDDGEEDSEGNGDNGDNGEEDEEKSGDEGEDDETDDLFADYSDSSTEWWDQPGLSYEEKHSLRLRDERQFVNIELEHAKGNVLDVVKNLCSDGDERAQLDQLIDAKEYFLQKEEELKDIYEELTRLDGIIGTFYAHERPCLTWTDYKTDPHLAHLTTGNNN